MQQILLVQCTYSQIHCITLHVCKLSMGFSFLSIIWVGVELMQITMQYTRPAWPENDPKLLKNSEGNHNDQWNFCQGQEADIALFLQETRKRKIIKSFEENKTILPKTVRSRAITSSEHWKTETNKVDRNVPITSKHVFPKRSAKMIDRTEKPKIPSKFAKHSAGYNEFGYNSTTYLVHVSLTKYSALLRIDSQN